MSGFFTDGGRQLGPKGLATLEETWTGARNYASKLQDKPRATATKFQTLAALADASITRQSFCWVEFSSKSILDRELRLLTLPMMSLKLSWHTSLGHPQCARARKELNSHFPKMCFFEADDGPLDGQRVATVSSFLRELGMTSMAKHVDDHRTVWVKSWMVSLRMTWRAPRC